jgi:hypothetical protein
VSLDGTTWTDTANGPKFEDVPHLGLGVRHEGAATFLTEGTEYFVRVRARNYNSRGFEGVPASNVIRATPYSEMAPVPALTATQVSACTNAACGCVCCGANLCRGVGTVTLTWSAPAGPVTGYRIQVRGFMYCVTCMCSCSCTPLRDTYMCSCSCTCHGVQDTGTRVHVLLYIYVSMCPISCTSQGTGHRYPCSYTLLRVCAHFHVLRCVHVLNFIYFTGYGGTRVHVLCYMYVLIFNALAYVYIHVLMLCTFNTSHVLQTALVNGSDMPQFFFVHSKQHPVHI